MGAPALDPKLIEIFDKIGDVARPVSELELHRMVRDLGRFADRMTDHQRVGEVFSHRALAHFRLKFYDKAIEDARIALQRLHAPTPRAYALITQGVALLESDQVADGASVLVEAARIDGSSKSIALANLAEALERLGHHDRAVEVFEEAERVGDFSDPRQPFLLAAQAAEIGLDAEAFELFATFIMRRRGADRGEQDAATIVRGASEDERAGVHRFPKLARTIRWRLAMADELERIAAVDDDDGPCLVPDVEDVFDATRRLREDAASRVLVG